MPVQTVFALEAQLVNLDILWHTMLDFTIYYSFVFFLITFRQQSLLQVVDTL